MIAGSAPKIVAHMDVRASEMLFVQYMPIQMPYDDIRIPQQLRCFKPLVDAAIEDDDRHYIDSYIYITAKHMYVDRDRCFNRHGWHIDGFGTDDINYIWSDRAPTEFCVQHFDLSPDCDESMRQMEQQARAENIRVYGYNVLLRLDNTMVHRVPPIIAPGFRTFVKISISRDQYNLEGNAHNYLFDYDWPMVPRGQRRNHPSAKD